MSAKPWSETSELPHGFRVTIERKRNGFVEVHSFHSKTKRLTTAMQAARYKQGFARLIKVVPLTREQWEREFPSTSRSKVTA